MIIDGYLQGFMNNNKLTEIQSENMNTDVYVQNELKYMTFVKSFQEGRFPKSRALELFADGTDIKNTFEEELVEVVAQARDFLGISEEDFMVSASRENFEYTIDSMLFSLKGAINTEEMSTKVFYSFLVASYTSRYLFIHTTLLSLERMVDYLEISLEE